MRQFVAVRVNAGRWDLYQCSKRSIKAKLIGSYPALTPIREYLGAGAIASSIVAGQIVYQANR